MAQPEFPFNEQTFRQVLTAAPSGYVITDAQGVIVFANQQAEAMFGYQSGELLGQSLGVLVPETSRPGYVQLHTAALEQPQIGKGGPRVPLMGRRKDGGDLPAEVTCFPLETESGRFVLSIFRDVSDRHRVDHQLRLSEDRYRNLLEAAPDGIVTVDRQGRIVYANAQMVELFGYTREELLGQRIEMLVPDRFRTGHVGHREGYFAHPRTRPMGAGLPLAGLRKDGSEFPVEIALSPMETPDEGLLTTAIVRDVTERRRMDELKDQFLSILSHELRTPINAITGFGSILQDGLAGPLSEQQQFYLQKLLGGADLLLNLVNDLLDMSRIQAGKFTLTLGVVDLEAIIREAVATIQPLADKSGLEVSIDVPELPDLIGDPQRVGQVLINLLSNAVKFSPEGGGIQVRARVLDHEVRVEVEDQGVGIDPKHFDLLFRPFTQFDMSSTRRVGGTGLGLSISKALVEAHGGHVGAKSDGPGKGACFWFTLPLESRVSIQG